MVVHGGCNIKFVVHGRNGNHKVVHVVRNIKLVVHGRNGNHKVVHGEKI
jgi:hypothetical protein